MGNLSARRGQVEHLEQVETPRRSRRASRCRRCSGPLTDLRSMSRGRATFTMQFDRYDEVPQSIASEIVDSQTSSLKETGGQAWVSRIRAHRSRTSTSAIGHIDHGKTTLTAAITKVLMEQGYEHGGDELRRDRQGPRGAPARHHHQHRASSTRRPTATTRTSTARGTPTTSRT